MNNLKEGIKKLLETVRHASMATVNEDGSPHNTPLLFFYDKNFTHLYWGSHPQSKHSQNILRTGQVYFAIYNSVDGDLGLYIRGGGARVAEGDELITALKIHNEFRKKAGKGPLDASYYTGDTPQRMWCAEVKQVWVNDAKLDKDGYVVKDFKIEIKLGKLLSV